MHLVRKPSFVEQKRRLEKSQATSHISTESPDYGEHLTPLGFALAFCAAITFCEPLFIRCLPSAQTVLKHTQKHMPDMATSELMENRDGRRRGCLAGVSQPPSTARHRHWLLQ
mmetsp:Transcript_50784/g.135471  ORF Transcript_50784/g.135471 Transcript_50784/m.135471 type:complete len:113 (+) Transcript_50784:390-728(+)